MSIIGCLGCCGSGKTTKLESIIAAELKRETLHPDQRWRFVALSRAHDPHTGRPELWRDDWPAYVRRKVWRVQSVSKAREALRNRAELVLVSPPDLDPSDEDGNRFYASELAEVAMAGPLTADGQKMRCALVLPEAHKAASQDARMLGTLKTLCHEFRKHRAGLLVDTQHAARINKEVLDECSVLYCFAQTSPRDNDKLALYGGREYRRPIHAAVQECGRRMENGEPGWYLRLRPRAVFPPFELHRDPY